jgi:hypothetical protein
MRELGGLPQHPSLLDWDSAGWVTLLESMLTNFLSDAA